MSRKIVKIALANRKKNTRFEDIPPNHDITVPMGPQVAVRRVFEEFDLDILLDSFKRRQGVPVSQLVMCMVTHAMQMTGLSINRLEDILDEPNLKEAYGLDRVIDKNDLYRAVERIGDRVDTVIGHLDKVLKKKFGLDFREVFTDWSSTYLDGKPTGFITFGHSKDHRSDRPQVGIGLVKDSATGMEIGLTVVPGNTSDKRHFVKSFKQVRPFLSPGCLIVFDNGAYSDDNAKLVKSSGFDYLTRAQWTPSDDRYTKAVHRWTVVPDEDGGIPPEGRRDYVRTYPGYKGVTKVMVFSEKKYEADMASYRAKAERDYKEAMELRSSIQKGKARKKYRNANWFIDTKQSYVFNLELMKDRTAAIEAAVSRQISGHEGYFILACSFDIDPVRALRTYRSRNDIEDDVRNLKSGIDLRPLRCRAEKCVKGRVLISFLALFVISFIRLITPKVSKHRAETVIENLISFSVRCKVVEGRVVCRDYSGFSDEILAIQQAFRCIK